MQTYIEQYFCHPSQYWNVSFQPRGESFRSELADLHQLIEDGGYFRRLHEKLGCLPDSAQDTTPHLLLSVFSPQQILPSIVEVRRIAGRTLKEGASSPISSIFAQDSTPFQLLVHKLRISGIGTKQGVRAEDTNGTEMHVTWTDAFGDIRDKKGTLRLEVRYGMNPNGREALCAKLTFFVTVSKSPSAISISFHKSPSGTGFCDVARIDVLPDESVVPEIWKGNTKVVKKIFEDQKIAPQHVANKGHSLASFAYAYGNSELYKLQLKGGAHPNYCGFHHCTIDLVTLIWTSWIDLLSTRDGPCTKDDNRAAETTVYDCISMSNEAIKHGCQIGCNLPWTSSRPNPLFLSDSEDPIRMIRYDELSVMFSYLVNTGFDLEARNNNEQTPLLYANMFLGHDTVPKIKALLSCGAKPNVQDIYGRGPLHCAVSIKLSRFTCSHALLSDHDEVVFWDWLNEQSMDDVEERPSLVDPVQHMDQASIDVDCVCDVCWDVLIGKLVAMLDAGCDPNSEDDDCRTPSDYAWRNGFMWFAWEQALAMTGWEFDDGTQQCVGIHVAMFEAFEKACE